MTLPAGARLRPAALLSVAGLLALISVGTSWGSRADMDYYWMPGFCVTAYDLDGWAYLDCSTAGYSYYGYDLESIPGYAMPARIMIVLAIVAIAAGYRLGRHPAGPDAARRAVRCLQVGLVAAAVAPLLNGLRLYPGQVLWWLALALLATALHREGRWPFRSPRRFRPSSSIPVPTTH